MSRFVRCLRPRRHNMSVYAFAFVKCGREDVVYVEYISLPLAAQPYTTVGSIHTRKIEEKWNDISGLAIAPKAILYAREHTHSTARQPFKPTVRDARRTKTEVAFCISYFRFRRHRRLVMCGTTVRQFMFAFLRSSLFLLYRCAVGRYVFPEKKNKIIPFPWHVFFDALHELFFFLQNTPHIHIYVYM